MSGSVSSLLSKGALMIIMDGSRTKNKKIGGGDILRTKNDDGSSEGGRRREGVAATHFDG